jgi:hypothetical protein
VNGAFTAGTLATGVPTGTNEPGNFTGQTLAWVRMVGDHVGGHFVVGTSILTLDFRKGWIMAATVSLPQIPLDLYMQGPPQPLSMMSGNSFSFRLVGNVGGRQFLGHALGQLFGGGAPEMSAVFTVGTPGQIDSGPISISGAFGGSRPTIHWPPPPRH